MKWASLKEALLETAKLTVMIFALIWGVLIFVNSGLCWITSRICGVDYWVTFHACRNNDIDTSWLCRPWDVHGRDWDVLLTLPVVYPAVIALGYDPIWFGIIVVKMCEVCLITPPVGLVAMWWRQFGPIYPWDVFRGIFPFFTRCVTIDYSWLSDCSWCCATS